MGFKHHKRSEARRAEPSRRNLHREWACASTSVVTNRLNLFVCIASGEQSLLTYVAGVKEAPFSGPYIGTWASD